MIKWRKLNRAVHRDLGYFFVGMAIIYGLSGIALNHKRDWNPNFIITQQTHELQLPSETPESPRELAMHYLKQLNLQDQYRTQLISEDNLRIFIQGGSINVSISSGTAQLETLRKRPVFNQINFLHYNTPRKLWTWFSDAFAAGLIILAITGMFILKGKNGITRRGAWLTGFGILIPLVLLFLYLNS